MRPHILIAVSLVAGALLLAEAALLLMKRRGGAPEELVRRVRAWWVMSAIFLGSVLTGSAGTFWMLGILSYLALKEYFTMIPIRPVDRRIVFWSYLTIPLQYWWAAIGWYGMFIVWIPVYAFLFLPFRQLLTGVTRGFLENTGRVQWGLMLLVFSLSHLAALAALPERNGADGVEMLLYLVMLTELNDVFQYLAGKRFGRRRILPAVSPNKTVEGFAGGVAATVVLALLLSFLTPFGPAEAAAAGLLIAVAGFVGDVVVSMVKRDVGIKDAGSLIPGHGGVLDRIDSLTYTAPLFFHAVHYFYY
jgi:phosphatidate cytidylyltransferase